MNRFVRPNLDPWSTHIIVQGLAAVVIFWGYRLGRELRSADRRQQLFRRRWPAKTIGRHSA